LFTIVQVFSKKLHNTTQAQLKGSL
jgi:hypothetical protein